MPPGGLSIARGEIFFAPRIDRGHPAFPPCETRARRPRCPMAIEQPPPMSTDPLPLSQVLRDLVDERFGGSVLAAARELGRRRNNMNRDSWETALRKILSGKQETVNLTTRRALARVFDVPEETVARPRRGRAAARAEEAEKRAAGAGARD